MAKIDRMDPSTTTITLSHAEVAVIHKALDDYTGRPQERDARQAAVKLFTALVDVRTVMDS